MDDFKLEIDNIKRDIESILTRLTILSSRMDEPDIEPEQDIDIEPNIEPEQDIDIEPEPDIEPDIIDLKDIDRDHDLIDKVILDQLTNSHILECEIHGVDTGTLTFNGNFVAICRAIGDGSRVIATGSGRKRYRTLPILGYKYLEDLGIAVRSLSAPDAISEFSRQAKRNHIQFKMLLQTTEGRFIKIIQ
jgi:hypothetical protein